MDENFDALCWKLQCQFLCTYQVNLVAWQELPTTLTWEQQHQLLTSTCAHPLNQKYPVKIGYQLNFLKRLLQVLERTHTEVHDAIYETYCQTQEKVAQDTTKKYAYKHYVLPEQDATFTLRESKSFVAAGTTGLCSWQASLALADYLLHNAKLVADKTVIELGAGTGLCGFILSLCCAVKQMLLTDGSAECVDLMNENIRRNFEHAKEVEGGFFAMGAQTMATTELPWHDVENANLRGISKPDMLLAADVTYDDSVFGDLMHAIDYIFNMMTNRMHMLLAATVRNEHTLNKFLELLPSFKFTVEEKNVVPPEQSFLYWDRTTPVRILLFSRNS